MPYEEIQQFTIHLAAINIASYICLYTVFSQMRRRSNEYGCVLSAHKIHPNFRMGFARLMVCLFFCLCFVAPFPYLFWKQVLNLLEGNRTKNKTKNNYYFYNTMIPVCVVKRKRREQDARRKAMDKPWQDSFSDLNCAFEPVWAFAHRISRRIAGVAPHVPPIRVKP